MSGTDELARQGPPLAMAVAAWAMAIAPGAFASESASGAGVADVIDASITDVYRPAHDAFAVAAATLERRVDALCAPDGGGNGDRDAAVDAAHAAFADAVARFSVVETMRVGPLLEDNRLNRLFYWPDRRRAGERQLRTLLSAPAAEITPASMPSRSVAVQGLPALERLLYPANDAPLDDPASSDCAAGTAIARNVAAVAAELDAAWRAEGGIAARLREPEDDDVRFRSHAEVLRALLTQLDEGLAVAAERKLGAQFEREPPSRRGAPFRRSALDGAHLGGNVEGLRALAIDSDLAALAGLEKELAFEFRVAAGHAASLDELARTASDDGLLDDDAAGLSRALISVLGSIRDTLRERLGPTLGVRTGFNSSDGD